MRSSIGPYVAVGLGLLVAACGKPAPSQTATAQAAPDVAQQAPTTPQIRIAQIGGTVFAATVSAPGKLVARAAEALPGTRPPASNAGSVGYSLIVILPSADAARVALGAAAQVRFPAFHDDVVAGRVVKITPAKDGGATLDITLPGDSRFTAGEPAMARIIATGAGITSVAVPPSAVLGPHSGAAAVFVVDLATTRVQRRAVMLGAHTPDGIGVTAGLNKGEWVALTRVDHLRDGMKIAPVGPSQ